MPRSWGASVGQNPISSQARWAWEESGFLAPLLAVCRTANSSRNSRVAAVTFLGSLGGRPFRNPSADSEKVRPEA